MSRPPRLLWTLPFLAFTAAGLSCAVNSAGSAAIQNERPNVLFIAIDDLRSSHASDDMPGLQMPEVRRFAETATEFVEHFVNAPSCGPSRAALLTGRDPGRTRALRNDCLYAGPTALARDPVGGARTWPELMRQNGYRTACIGKISHTPDGRVYAYDGSGDGREELPDAWDELLTPYGPWERGWGAFFAYPGGAHREDGQTQPHLIERSEEGHPLPDELIAMEACQRLERFAAANESPFCLAVGFYKPHLPWVGDGKVEGGESPSAWADELVKTPYLHGSGEFRRYTAPWGDELPAGGSMDARRARNAYTRCAHFVDRQVGLVLDALERSGLADSTIVVLWSDHGFHLGESGVWGKHTLLDRSLHSPLMIRVPGRGTPGVAAFGLASTIDIYPTLAELCHLDTKGLRAPLDGVSLVPMLDSQQAVPRAACTAYWGSAATVRTQDRRVLARWSGDGWGDLRVIDQTQGPDPRPAELTTPVDPDDPEVAALLARLVPPTGTGSEGRAR